jgi:hypothetical protein
MSFESSTTRNTRLRGCTRYDPDDKTALEGQQWRTFTLPNPKWRKLALRGVMMGASDELAAIVSPCLGGLLLIFVPDDNDDRLRVVDGGLEARIWNSKRGWTYEIASFKSAVVLARGEKSSAYEALERSISLLRLLHEDSGVMRHAA